MEIKNTQASPTVQVHAMVKPVSRKTKNAARVISGFWRKVDKRGKIQVLKQKVKQQKHAFGIRYMDLYERGADAAALDLCIRMAWPEIKALDDKIALLREDIARIETETQSKIIRKGTPAHTTPSVSMTDSRESTPYRAESGAQDYDPPYAFATTAEIRDTPYTADHAFHHPSPDAPFDNTYSPSAAKV